MPSAKPEQTPEQTPQTERQDVNAINPLPQISAPDAEPVLPGPKPAARRIAPHMAGTDGGSDGPAPALAGRMKALHGRLPVLLLLGLGFWLAALWGWPQNWALGLAGAGTAIAVLALAAALFMRLDRDRRQHDEQAILRLLSQDPDMLVLTDTRGRRRDGAGAAAGDPALLGALARSCADPQEMVDTLSAEARVHGNARLELGRGLSGLLITVQSLTPGSGGEDFGGTLLWRLAELERPAQRDISALGLPVLTLGDGTGPPLLNPALLRVMTSGLPGSLAADPREAVLALLGPLIDGPAASMDLNLPDGQPARALVLPGRDGLRDIILLPQDVFGGEPAGQSAARDFDEIPIGLVRLDGAGRVAGTNRASRVLMGLADDDQRFLWEVVEGLGRPVADWLEDARSGRALNRPEVLRVIRPGAEVFVQIILRRQNALADPDALLAVVTDATELKSLEARFVQSQKMQAIGQLAGGVAHDFNNLLTAISGHCDLLLSGRDQFDPDYSDLLQIHQNANRAAALVRQLLAFSRKQTLQPVRLNLEGLLEDVVHLLTRLVGERITLSLRHEASVPPIRADRRQLEQVIVNLVVNARDAMPMGGEIRIETLTRWLGQDHRIGRVRMPPGEYAVVQVIDCGIGIPDDQIDKVFEPFYTTKRPGEGTGLGLSTAYGIVKQMGGYIFVESVEGSGTTFTLYFGADRNAELDAEAGDGAGPSARAPRQIRKPAQGREAQGLAAQGRASQGHADAALLGGGRPTHDTAGTASGGFERGGDALAERPAQGLGNLQEQARPSVRHPALRKDAELHPGQGSSGMETGAGIVLLVEDEAPVRAFAARALRMRGYQVLEAQDGEQALEALADPALAIDIFVTDVIMPGRDGPAWVEEALRTRPGTPVVFMSGYIEDSLNEALARTPQAAFLEKPFSLDGLCRAIDRQLGADSG